MLPGSFEVRSLHAKTNTVGQVIITGGKPSAPDLPPHAHCWIFVFGVSSSALSQCIYIYIFSLEGEDATCLCLRGLSALKLLLLRHMSIKPQLSSCTPPRGIPSWASLRRPHVDGVLAGAVALGSACIKVHRSPAVVDAFAFDNDELRHRIQSRRLSLDGYVCLQLFS